MERHIFHQGQLKWILSWGEIERQAGSRWGHLHSWRLWTWLGEALSSPVWLHSWACSGQKAGWRLPWSLLAQTAWWSYQHEGEKCLTDSVSCSFPFPRTTHPHAGIDKWPVSLGDGRLTKKQRGPKCLLKTALALGCVTFVLCKRN